MQKKAFSYPHQKHVKDIYILCILEFCLTACDLLFWLISNWQLGQKMIFCFSGTAAFVLDPRFKCFQEWCPYLCQIDLASDAVELFLKST